MCRPLFSLLIGMFLSSCTGNTLYHHYQSLPAEGWERRDTVCFELPRQEKDIRGTLFIGLCTTAQVGFRDIVLAVEQCDEMSNVCRRDTVRYQLTNAEGDALGKGVNIHQYETQQLPIHLPKDQRSTIRIHHLMRHETIYGITELGIKIDKTL